MRTKFLLCIMAIGLLFSTSFAFMRTDSPVEKSPVSIGPAADIATPDAGMISNPQTDYISTVAVQATKEVAYGPPWISTKLDRDPVGVRFVRRE